MATLGVSAAPTYDLRIPLPAGYGCGWFSVSVTTLLRFGLPFRLRYWFVPPLTLRLRVAGFCLVTVAVAVALRYGTVYRGAVVLYRAGTV